MRLTELKGIGEKTEELFGKLGVADVEGLLEFYPRDFEVFARPIVVSEIGYKTFASVKGVFLEKPTVRRAGKLKILTGIFSDEIGGRIRATWFNAPYLADSIETGKFYVMRGRITHRHGTLEFNQPRLFSLEEYNSLVGVMQPIYPLTKGISNNVIVKTVKKAIDSPAFTACAAGDVLPAKVREKYGLIDKKNTILRMHFPESSEDFSGARSRAAFEELFTFVLTMKKNEVGGRPISCHVFGEDERTRRFLRALPFRLTDAQEKVIAEINRDTKSGLVMNRLVQGDVGSGKTMIALAACMNAAFAGGQAAFMAPTEVLAEQHFKTIGRLFKEYGISLHVGLLTGSMSALEKKVVYDALELGRIDIVVGTHALFQEKAVYKNLALVITDEQHRFGTKQREALTEKGIRPHMIVMSATPIPRTLALIIYGNMDVSTIDALPGGRLPIKNAVVDESYRPKAYRFIEKQVAEGRQVYVICPLIEYSEGLEAANVTDYSEMLRDTLSEGISVGMLHGAMKPEQKNEIMAKFAGGDIDVLVSTTVIEVGVDVPNATVMMIEDANRFGLATLHQLRGRVGRGSEQSYCIFVSNNKSKEAMERLEILKTSNDGFEIASRDLDMRGPGEFLGTRQSGSLTFRNFDVVRDIGIASKAVEAANLVAEGSIELTGDEKAALDKITQLKKSGIVL